MSDFGVAISPFELEEWQAATGIHPDLVMTAGSASGSFPRPARPYAVDGGTTDAVVVGDRRPRRPALEQPNLSNEVGSQRRRGTSPHVLSVRHHLHVCRVAAQAVHTCGPARASPGCQRLGVTGVIEFHFRRNRPIGQFKKVAVGSRKRLASVGPTQHAVAGLLVHVPLPHPTAGEWVYEVLGALSLLGHVTPDKSLGLASHETTAGSIPTGDWSGLTTATFAELHGLILSHVPQGTDG
jgi:hypothetical protein